MTAEAVLLPPHFPLDPTHSVFLLRKTSCHSTISIEVDFSPIHAKTQASACSPLRTLPTFHRDRNYFTPSFILEVDQEKYDQNVEAYRNVHDGKLLQISEQKSEIFVPKPSKNNSFCCVCKTPFDDYLEHLNQPKHRYLIKKSDYHPKLKEICSQFTQTNAKPVPTCPQRKKRGRPAKGKPIKKQSQSSKSLSGKETCEDDSLENGCKTNQVTG